MNENDALPLDLELQRTLRQQGANVGIPIELLYAEPTKDATIGERFMRNLWRFW